MADTPEQQEIDPDADPAAQAAENGDTPAGDSQEPEDYDSRMLREAEEAAAAEANPASEGEQEPAPTTPASAPEGQSPEPTGGDQAPAAAAPSEPKGEDGKQQQGSEPPPMYVPKSRLDEVSRQRDSERDEKIYWKGVADARAQAAAAPQQQPGEAGQQQPQAPQKTPQEQLDEIAAQEIELAQKWDDGEISASEMVREQQALRVREREVIAAAQKGSDQGQQPQQEQQPAPSLAAGDIVLAERTQQLREAHPMVTHLDEDEVDQLADMALRSFQREGNPLRFDDSPSEALRWRTRIAELSDTFGPAFLRARGIDPNSLAAPSNSGQPAAPSPQPSGGNTPAPQTETAAQRAAKLAASGQHPPETASMGNADHERPPFLTEARVMELSSKQMEDLPDDVLAKFLANPQ